MGGAPYVLEVGSPGVDRPLTQPRHWRRAVGRLVKTRLAAGDEILGRVLEADDEGATLAVQPVKGRGAPTGHRLGYAEVAKAQVQVEFGRKDDASDEGDDEIKEEA
jgi:ribosome maturation factor RimP